MCMAPPPVEIIKAEESLLMVDADTTFTLVTSKRALQDAAELKIDLSCSDFPLFVADRLAFASPNGGLQVRNVPCWIRLYFTVLMLAMYLILSSYLSRPCYVCLGSTFFRKERLPCQLQSPSRHQPEPTGNTQHSVDHSE
jgi:hypothetical protein